MSKMLSFNWPLITATTIVLYGLIILTLPFNTTYATILLFSLIGFWSRLPGVCIYEPVRFMYLMDFIDIFAIIIAIYVGPLQGAAFALVWNIFPRLCGGFTLLLGNIKDGIAQALLCFAVPVFNVIFGGDLLLVVVTFSLVRLPLFFLLSLILPSRPIVEQIFHLAIAGLGVMIINSFYAKIFGDFFSGLLLKGASFSWTLFLIATVVILVFAITVYGFSPKKASQRMGKRIVKIAKSKIQKPKKEDLAAREELSEMRKIRDSL